MYIWNDRVWLSIFDKIWHFIEEKINEMIRLKISNYQKDQINSHLLLSKMVSKSGLSDSGLSIPSLRARASLLT